MARPLSLDLRERIVAAVEGGLSRRAAAERFQVSESCAIKLLQRWKRTGSAAPGRIGGRKRFALEPHEALVRELVAAHPDATLDELAARLADEAIEVGRTSIFRFLKALGLTHKKRPSTPASRTGPTSPKPGRPGARASRR
jgi:putative transposase